MFDLGRSWHSDSSCALANEVTRELGIRDGGDFGRTGVRAGGAEDVEGARSSIHVDV